MPDAPFDATLEAVSDETLARRIAFGGQGSTDAEQAELYRRFAPRVRLYGRRHLRSGAAADDLAQEVLLLTIERLRAGEVRRPEEIGSFILGTSKPSYTAASPRECGCMAAATCGAVRPPTTSRRRCCCSPSSAFAPVRYAGRRRSDRSFWGPAA